MKTIAFQKIEGCPVPHSLEDADLWNDFKENQITIHKVQGTKKAPSLRKHNLFMACCEFVANNTEDVYWNSKEKAKQMCKVVYHLVDDRFTCVRPDNQVNFVYKSLEFYRPVEKGGLTDKDRHKFYEASFDILADKIGMYQDQLIREAQAIMKDHWNSYVRRGK